MLRFGAAAGRLVIQPHLCRGIWRPLNDLWRGRASPHELPEGYLQIAIFAAQIFVLRLAPLHNGSDPPQFSLRRIPGPDDHSSCRKACRQH
jgi:hypothetical protein